MDERWEVSRVLRGAAALLLPTECAVKDFMVVGSGSSFAMKSYACASLRFLAGNISLSVDCRGNIQGVTGGKDQTSGGCSLC